MIGFDGRPSLAACMEQDQVKEPESGITKDHWVALFQEIGLDEARMTRWHQLFEARHPAAHQSFLEWLGIAPDEIGRIRTL